MSQYVITAALDGIPTSALDGGTEMFGGLISDHKWTDPAYVNISYRHQKHRKGIMNKLHVPNMPCEQHLPSTNVMGTAMSVRTDRQRNDASIFTYSFLS